MAFDEDKHELHPETGFMVHKETRHPVGLVPPPAAKSTLDPEYPKWVTPSPVYVVRQTVDGAPDHVSTPAWPHFHVDRINGAVTVLVNNEDEEAAATTEPKAAADAEPDHHSV